jgi:hypothetical protein
MTVRPSPGGTLQISKRELEVINEGLQWFLHRCSRRGSNIVVVDFVGAVDILFGHWLMGPNDVPNF